MKLLNSILFALIYTVGYIFLAILSTGGGHGNFVTLLLLPTWIFNYVALVLLVRLNGQLTKIFFVVLMTVYYSILILILVNAFYDQESKIYLASLIFPLGWFLGGQLILWAVFTKAIINAKFTNISQN